MIGPPTGLVVCGEWFVKVLVSGGAGFIGSHLVDRLVHDGHTVVALDDFSRGSHDHLYSAIRTGRCSTIERSILDAGLEGAMRDAEPEVVVHLAAQIDVRASVQRPREDAVTNVIGTVAVLDAARQAGVRKVVLASSVAIFGPVETLPVREHTPVNPLSPYAVSKLSAEYYLQQYQRLYGLETTTLVMTNTYGPRQDPHGEAGVVAIFADQMLRGRPTQVFGDGTNSRDYVYVEDVADALARACGPVATGRRLVIGTGIATTDRELHRAVAEAVGGAPEPRLAPARLGDLPHMVVDAAEARRTLGWVPNVALSEGIKRTVEAIREPLET